MGYTPWKDAVYTAKVSSYSRSATGGFDHDHICKATGVAKVHEKMDPKGVNRESRDSKEHPESLSIICCTDLTGSMSETPKIFVAKLGALMSLLLKKGYVDHPQIMFSGVGDATCDSVPLQVGQFESGDEQTDDLTRLYLEGGGGGQQTESYELAMYFFSRHCKMDCVEKRNKKAYLFFYCDELPYPEVDKNQVGSIIGDKLQANISLADMVEELKQKFEVFVLIPSGSSYYGDSKIFNGWKNLFGDHVLKLQDPNLVAETIASLIGVSEGCVDTDELEGDLKDVGVDSKDVKSVTNAIATYSGGKAGAIAKKAKVDGSLPVKKGKVSVESV